MGCRLGCQNLRVADAPRKEEETFGQKSVAWSGNHATTGSPRKGANKRKSLYVPTLFAPLRGRCCLSSLTPGSLRSPGATVVRPLRGPRQRCDVDLFAFPSQYRISALNCSSRSADGCPVFCGLRRHRRRFGCVWQLQVRQCGGRRLGRRLVWWFLVWSERSWRSAKAVSPLRSATALHISPRSLPARSITSGAISRFVDVI